jgi:hypothetical protein
VFEGGAISDIAVEAAVLTAFAIVLMAVSAVMLRRAVTRP